MSADSVPQKRCSKCGIEYPATAEYFYRDKCSKDGLRVQCKSCRCKHQQTYYHNEYRERQLANQKHRRETDSKYREYQASFAEWRRVRIAERRKDPEFRASEKEKRHIRQTTPAYRIKHRHYERIRQQKPEIREQRRQYRQTERGKMLERANQARRRACKLAVGGSYTTEDIRLQIRSQTDKKGKLRCWWCGKVIKGKYHIDHRIPLIHGGSNDVRNLCIAHPVCNHSKGSKLPHEWNGRLL